MAMPDDDYLMAKEFKKGIGQIISAIDRTHAAPMTPEEFAIAQTVNVPPNVDTILDVPANTKTILIFPKAGANISKAVFFINNQFYFPVPGGQTFPLVLRILPEWKTFNIPAAQDGTVAGQMDLIFSSREYRKGTL